MKYSVLTAPIEHVQVPTGSFMNPVTIETRYTEAATILDFATEQAAIEHVQQFLPFDTVMALPGQRDGLEFYANLWMGEGENCLQDLPTLAEKLADAENFFWTYGQDDADALKDALEEHDDCTQPKTDGDDDKMVVGAYLMGDSRLLGGRSCMSMMFVDLEFDELTEIEQLRVIDTTTVSRKKVTVDNGLMFDLWCMKKCKNNKSLATMLALKIYINDTVRSKCYNLQSRISSKYIQNVTAFNQWRIDKGWVK